jgi:DNA-binding transcriptional regulator YiaG
VFLKSDYSSFDDYCSTFVKATPLQKWLSTSFSKLLFWAITPTNASRFVRWREIGLKQTALQIAISARGGYAAIRKRIMTMEQALFDDLIQSLKEAKAIAKGETQASRRFTVKPPDVKAVREQIGLSQSEFARLMRVSVKTLQNWEQHRRTPAEPSAALLKIVSHAPDAALKALHA